MNFDEIVVKESPGLCRCCLSEGCYKDLSSEYSWMNETEVYADMLLECFDISISQHSDGPNGANRLICEVCITRLRDACNFKKQVTESEKRFIDMLAKGEFQPKVIIYDQLMKAEELEPPPEDAECDTVEYLEDDMDYEDDLPLKQVLGTAGVTVSDVTAEPIKIKTKRGRPKKTSVVKSEKRKPAEEKPRTSKTVVKGANPPLAMTATKRNRLMKRNAILILENTTVVPFKWHRQNYLCFFCHEPFKDFDDLKTHMTIEKGKNASIKAAVSYLRRDEKVKIDLIDARCTLCSTILDTFENLTEHLKRHGKVFSEGDFGVIPYCLERDKFNCALCKQQFQYFVKLNQHLNAHFGKYICEACGKSFLSQDRLRCHALSHGQKFSCSECSEVFDSLSQRTQHEIKRHNKVKIQCFYCKETFRNYAQRKIHHQKDHNIQMKEFRCTYCNKTFQIMSKMKVHVKEVHLKERNYSCSMCEQRFFSKTHVQKHMIKHFGERVHQCTICSKSYARKQTLRDHMRIHSSDKRFTCALCDSGFVQNNSLRLHMRVHHPESVNV